MKSIKKKYGSGYTIKCNKDNFINYFTLNVPIDDNGNFSIEMQKTMVEDMKQKERLLEKLLENGESLKLIKNYAKYLAVV